MKNTLRNKRFRWNGNSAQGCVCIIEERWSRWANILHYYSTNVEFKYTFACVFSFFFVTVESFLIIGILASIVAFFFETNWDYFHWLCFAHFLFLSVLYLFTLDDSHFHSLCISPLYISFVLHETCSYHCHNMLTFMIYIGL